MVDLNIPVGVSDFEKLRENNYYYIDKTGFISKLLQTKSAEVTLITRPRRFGKTLGMRMLASFFDIRKDSRTIFEGLEISKNTALCNEWMNQYPTLFLSFKDVDVYCPWDVMNCMRDLQYNPDARLQSYWKNTSDNDIVRSFIDYA